MTTALAAPSRLVTEERTALVTMPGDTPNADPVRTIAKIGPRGQLRQLVMHVPIVPARNEAHKIRLKNPETGAWENTWVLSVIGYDKCNAVRGVSFVAPETLLWDDGNVRPNPFHLRDQETHELQLVRVRRIGIARSATGAFVAEDLTVTFDLRDYFTQDLWAKWRGKSNEQPKTWGKLVPASRLPELKPMENAYRVPGDLALVVDITNLDFISVIGEHNNRRKFAERIALSICRRNILARFIAVRRLDPQAMSVRVSGWPMTDRDVGELGRAAADANEGKMTYEGMEVQVNRAAATVSEPEDVDAAFAGDGDEEMQAATVPDDDAQPVGTATAPIAESLGEELVEKYHVQARELCARIADAAIIHEALVPQGFENLDGVLKETRPAMLEGVVPALQKAELAAIEAKKKATTKAEPKTTAKK